MAACPLHEAFAAAAWVVVVVAEPFSPPVCPHVRPALGTSRRWQHLVASSFRSSRLGVGLAARHVGPRALHRPRRPIGHVGDLLQHLCPPALSRGEEESFHLMSEGAPLGRRPMGDGQALLTSPPPPPPPPSISLPGASSVPSSSLICPRLARAPRGPLPPNSKHGHRVFVDAHARLQAGGCDQPPARLSVGDELARQVALHRYVLYCARGGLPPVQSALPSPDAPPIALPFMSWPPQGRVAGARIGLGADPTPRLVRARERGLSLPHARPPRLRPPHVRRAVGPRGGHSRLRRGREVANNVAEARAGGRGPAFKRLGSTPRGPLNLVQRGVVVPLPPGRAAPNF